MDVQAYKRRLLELEMHLSRDTARLHDDAVAQRPDGPRDEADESVADLVETEAFAEAEIDATTLHQVRDALQRIDDGTFGRCVVDGGPIEERRLEAVPWTPYCARHARQREAETPHWMPTL